MLYLLWKCALTVQYYDIIAISIIHIIYANLIYISSDKQMGKGRPKIANLRLLALFFIVIINLLLN